MSDLDFCLHCQKSLDYAGKQGRKNIVFACNKCGCVYLNGEHIKDGKFHRTQEDIERLARAVQKYPNGEDLFGK